MVLVRLAWTIIIFAVLWLFLIWWWMARNPEYAKQIRNKEAPYTWFFYVWGFLVIGAGVSGIGLVLYYIYDLVSMLVY